MKALSVSPLRFGAASPPNGPGTEATDSLKTSGDKKPPILMTTLDQLPGYTVKPYQHPILGVSVVAVNFGRQVQAQAKNLVGGAIKPFQKVIEEATRTAMRELEDQARKLGANAVVGIRPFSTTLAAESAEVVVIGTAANLEPEKTGGVASPFLKSTYDPLAEPPSLEPTPGEKTI